MSRKPPSPSGISPSPVTRMTSFMPLTVMEMLLSVGSRLTEEMAFTMVSFCMSSRNSRSAENSINSQSTPMVIEKQNAVIARYPGES